MVQNVLRRPAVTSVTGLAPSTLYELMARDAFPKPISLGARAVGWLESEVLAWQRDRVAERDRGASRREAA